MLVAKILCSQTLLLITQNYSTKSVPITHNPKPDPMLDYALSIC